MKADKLTMDLRIRMVMEWMMDGFMTKDIITQCTSKWGIDERMAYKYIKQAKKTFLKITEDDMKERLAFHIAARMKIYNAMSDKNKPAGARVALDFLKDIADLEGFYMQKVDVTTQGNAIHSQEFHTTLILK